MHRWQVPVTIENCAHSQGHQAGESATHPIEPPWRTLAVLLLLAGDEPASSSRLASARHGSPLGRVQLRFLGSNMTTNDRKTGSPSERLPMVLAIAVVTFALACAILLALVSELSPRI